MDKILIVGILLIYVIKENVRADTDCQYYCRKFYERTSGLCSENEQNDCLQCCQQCIKGNVIDMDNQDSCVKLEFKQEPVQEMPPARVNSTVVILCVFNVKVQCKWELNGQEVDTRHSSRIRLAHSTESYTTTCSLIISRASMADAGQWTCSNAPIAIEHNTNHTNSTTTWLQVYQPDQPTQRPDNHHILENESPDGQRLDDQTPSFSLKTSPYLIAGIAVALTIVLVLISVVIYKKLCAKRQSNYRFESSNTESLLSAHRNREPVQYNVSITINTPNGKDIVTL